ncbi:peroxiredoxin [Acrocarpospora phusangensis]|uniref:Alkyl hydroperoxide reductase E n=1 Tax=Acrocarpospora phusangensis TaxID=1070424 RepID=A0A919UQB1_9ACTN|nr:peroxiredoxin [Acrocarpospora phusangensis]GIH29614.1 peroxiredoxin [Acrocarpospora phusangensis]
MDIGGIAPDFELADQHGTPVRLSGLRGEPVVIVFFPAAFTGICQGELHDLASVEARVLAVSVDSMFSLRAWADREGYSFPLLSDFWPHGQVARAYGVLDEERGLARRGTFILDGDGVLRWQVVTEIGRPRDVTEYRKVLTQL